MAKALLLFIGLLILGLGALSLLAPTTGAQTSGALSQVHIPQPVNVTIEVDGVQVQAGDNHADAAHPEAALVRSACQNRGHYQLWMEPDKKTFHRLCQLDDGRWGDWIVTLEGKIKIEKSAFVPKDGTWTEIMNWLARKGATRFTKPW